MGKSRKTPQVSTKVIVPPIGHMESNKGTINVGGTYQGSGRPKLTINALIDEMRGRGLHQITKEDIRKAYEYMIGMSSQELDNISKDVTDYPMFMVIVAKSLIKDGMYALETVLSRAQGKPSTGVEMKIESQAPDFSNLSNEELAQYAAMLEKITPKDNE